MKILHTLQTVLSKIERKEAAQFREYAIYKNEKKLLRLFDVLYKYDKKLEMEYLLLYLKKKKLGQNLRNSSNNLYKLLLSFWNDNPPLEDKNLQIGELMHGASVLVQRGLIEEGLALYKKAEVLAETGEKYSYQYEILRLSSHWSNFSAPKKAIKTLDLVKEKAEIIGKKMDANLAANLLSAKVHYTWLNSNESLYKNTSTIFEQATTEALKLLGRKECTIRTKFVCHDILSKINTLNPEGKNDLIEFHAKECIHLAESMFKEDPKKFGPIIIYKIIALLNFYFSEINIHEYKIHLQKFRKYQEQYKGKDRSLEFRQYEVELLNCILNKDYQRAENMIIPATLIYLEKNDKKIAFSDCWDLYSLCLEINLCIGNLEQVAWYLGKMTQNDKQVSLSNTIKYYTRLFSLLYNFELSNFQYVENDAKSTRRLYSDLVKNNLGGKIFLKYLIKLSQANNHADRIPIFQDFKPEIDAVFENSHYVRVMGVNILADWIEAKANGVNTIKEFNDLKLKQQHIA